jgi:cytochrome c oxidase cbb3-type subunit 3
MNRLTKYILFFTPLLLSSGIIKAAENTTNSTGISDSTLLMLLVGVIIVLLIIISFLTSMLKNISASNYLWEKNKNCDNNNKNVMAVVTTLFLLGSYNKIFAAGGESVPYAMSNTTFWLLMSVIIILLAIALQLLVTIRKLIRKIAGTDVIEENAEILGIKLTDSVPVEHEKDILLDHDYDGIKELDNNLPPWWLYMFYLSIAFSVFYFAKHHIFGDGDIMYKQYNEQMAEAEVQIAEYMKIAGNSIDENNVEALTDAGAIAEGKDIYTKNCIACHGANGEGGVGPNLTDNYWLHGCGIKNIFKTIKNGVPEKGMISWKTQLSPVQIQQVASYIITLHGTNPAGAKEPQGDECNE